MDSKIPASGSRCVLASHGGLKYCPEYSEIVTRTPQPGVSLEEIEHLRLSSVGALLPDDALGCPIRATMGVLGRKWALIILRDIAFRPNPTFGFLLQRSKGLTPRVLTNRLRELRQEELIEKVADAHDERKVHYRLTTKGKDVVPILMALSAFGLRHLVPPVGSGSPRRTLEQTFPGLAPGLLRDLYRFALSPPSQTSHP
jgi:DNA-binding HxlR family transcriptional regulator